MDVLLWQTTGNKQVTLLRWHKSHVTAKRTAFELILRTPFLDLFQTSFLLQGVPNFSKRDDEVLAKVECCHFLPSKADLQRHQQNSTDIFS